ncbi:MAG: hypothetical protein Q9221_005607 [Calogaya cf. arnoldii]
MSAFGNAFQDASRITLVRGNGIPQPQKFNITEEEERSSNWRCAVHVSPEPPYVADCQKGEWQLTKEIWIEEQTDRELQVALQGGVDVMGHNWVGRSGNATLAETFGRQFWNEFLKFTLANPCQHALDCNSVGWFSAYPLGSVSKPDPTPWVFMVTAAFVNINQQLRNQYDELKDAIESLALDTISIDDFFPVKSQDFSLFNSLTGLSGIFSILGGFIPVAGPFIAAAGTIASSVGTFLQKSAAASSNDPLEAQKTFSQKVLTFYRATLSAMDDLFAKLFIREPIPGPGPGSFTLLDMMEGGAWVNPNALTNVSNLNDNIRREILARSIDSLWKSRTHEQTIKMWVLFTDLSNDPDSKECLENIFEACPPDSKHCADGGVYYTYNFWEQKSGGGGVGWPYGADKLRSSAGIELKWVTEASAKSYRAMKAIGQDPFNFNQTAGTSQFLATAFTGGEGNPDLSEFAGRFPGSWTLPVCDASTCGKAWNWDYTGEKNDIRKSVHTHPPCLCGKALLYPLPSVCYLELRIPPMPPFVTLITDIRAKSGNSHLPPRIPYSHPADTCATGPNGLETYDWAKAAGLSGFETFWHRCNYALRDKRYNFQWPEGVTFVDYPADTGNKDFKLKKP